MIVISLLGGPGCGKSTNATALFSLMKRSYMNVEYVHEYAKDLVYEGKLEILKEQNHILDVQDQMLRRLTNHVDFAVTDGALINSIVYTDSNYHIPPNVFKKVVLAYHNKYNNIVFYLKRTKKYVPIGRTQTEQQAQSLDTKVYDMLVDNNIDFTEIVADDTAPKAMFDHIQNLITLDTKA